MADEKKKREARQGLQGFKEIYDEHYRKVNGLPPKEEEETKDSPGLLKQIQETLTKRDPEALNRIMQPLVESTGGKLMQAGSQFEKGNVAAGSLGVVNTLLGVVASLFTLGSSLLKEIPGVKPAVETAEKPFELAAQGEQYVENKLGTALDKIGIKSNLGLSDEQAKEVQKAISEINQFGTQAIVGSLLGTGMNKVKSKLLEVKPTARNIEPETTDIKGELPPSPIDQARMKAEQESNVGPSRTPFQAGAYGQNKRVVPESEKAVVQEMRTMRDDLEIQKAGHNARLNEIQTEIKSLRTDDSYSINTKKSKIKTLRNEATGLQKALTDLDKQLEPINQRLDYYGERVDQWRPEGHLLEEHAGVGEPTDMSGTNTPVNINFQKAKQGGRVISNMPDKMAPGMTGSPIDRLAGGDLVYARDAIRDNKLLHEILQEGINQGKEAHVYQVLMTAAKKLGLEEETRGAIMDVLDQLQPKKGPMAKSLEAGPKIDAVAKSDYNARIKEYLRGTFRKQEGEVNNAVQIESPNEGSVRRSTRPGNEEQGKDMGRGNAKGEETPGARTQTEVGQEKGIGLKPPTEPQVKRDVSKEGSQKTTPELPQEARIENKEVSKPVTEQVTKPEEVTKLKAGKEPEIKEEAPSETKSVTKSPARDILHQETEDFRTEHLDAALERIAERPWNGKSKEVQKGAKDLIPEVKDLMREAGLTKDDLKEVMDKPGEARKMLKENLFKTPREHAILSPVNELPEGLKKKMQANAKEKLAELEESSVEHQGATFQRDNVGNGDEVVNSTGSFTIDNFPEWYRNMGEKSDRVKKALEKIATGVGDEGTYVERLKGIIYDHLTKGETLSELHGNSGRYEKVSRGVIPADREVGKFHATHGERPMSRAEMKELYEAMPKPKAQAKSKAEAPKVETKLSPEMEKLKRAEKHWQEKYVEALDDPFTAEETLHDMKKRLRHVQKRIKLMEAADEARTDIQKRGIENLNKLGAGVGGLDPVIMKDYVIVGRDYMARGVDRFTDWSREMAREFGDAIRPHLRVIWSAVQKEAKKEKPEEATLLQQEVRAEIADRVISKNLDKAQQEKVRRAMEEYLGSHKVMTANKAQDNFKLIEKVGYIVKKYKKAGGELAMRAINGDYKREHILKNVYDEFISPLKELREKTGFLQFNQMGRNVIQALEDRANSTKYIKTEMESQIYDRAVKFYDYFKGELEKAGFPVLEDYFTHIMNANEFEAILSDLKLPENVDYRSLAHFISSDSRFTKVRKGANMPLDMDLLHVMDTYAHSVTKALSFKDLVDYYYTDFLKDMPEVGGKPSTQLAMRYMDSVLNPEIASGKIMKVIEKARNTVYRALLWNNLKSGTQNGLQKELGRMFMTKEAIALTDKAYSSHELTGELADAMAEIKRTSLYYTELAKSPLKAHTKLGKAAEKVGDTDFFQYEEKTNWKYTELGGVINHAVKTSKFKELKAKGMEDFKAINEVLKDQKTFELAVREGVDLSSRTQINPSAAYRPFFYDAPAARVYGMFTRFKFGQIQLLAQTLFKPLEGAEGLRAQTILRRGVSPEAKPVETLYAVEYYRKNLEVLNKQLAKEPGVNLGVEKKFIQEYVDYLKGQEKELNSIIKELEPLSGDRAALAARWAKYFMKGAAIAFTFSFISDTLANYVHRLTTGKERDEKDKKTPGKYAVQVARDINPLPGTGTFTNPLIPDVDLFLFGNFNKRGITKTGIQWLMNVLPGLGAASRLTKFATGFDAANEATITIFPKKDSSGQGGRSGGRGSRGGR
ncbi:MAG: hypothetical protein ACM3QX_18215 [Syntrophomonadaceae bacterium]